MPGANPMAVGQPGAIPGGPMGPGGALAAGAVPGGPMGQGGGVQAPPPDSAEFPAFKMAMGIAAGEWDTIGEFISVKATGQLRDLRTKTMSEPKKDELKKEISQLIPLSSKTVSGGKQLTFKSGTTIFTMVVKKENGAFKVAELTRRAGK